MPMYSTIQQSHFSSFMSVGSVSILPDLVVGRLTGTQQVPYLETTTKRSVLLLAGS